MTGTLLGNYKLLEKLGQGGMGEVYRAEHRRIPRQVAIKVLLPEFSSNAGIVDRFFAEARAAATINHPSVVEIVDCDMQDGRAYIVMALLQGESLGGRLRRQGDAGESMRVSDAVAIARDIARGMGAAHAKGIIHRDLKPDNVFMHAPSPDAPVQVKILDFGIAKLAGEGATNSTRTGAIIGTPLYMSPEQCRGAGKVDLRTDIYSLGCMLFEMFCGRPPFVREGSGELIAAHLSEVPQSVMELRPSLPAGVDALVRRTMAKSVDERFQTMEEVGRALAGLGLGDAPVTPRPPEPATPVPSASSTKLLPENEAVSQPAVQTTLSRATGEVKPASWRTTEEVISDGARRTGRSRVGLAVGVVGAIALVVGIGVVSKGGRSPEGKPPVLPEHVPASKPPPEPPVAVVQPPPLLPVQVVITVMGAPSDITAKIDGRAASLPLKLARSATDPTEIVFRAHGYADYKVSVLPDRDKDLLLTMEPKAHETPKPRAASAAEKPKQPKLPHAIIKL